MADSITRLCLGVSTAFALIYMASCSSVHLTEVEDVCEDELTHCAPGCLDRNVVHGTDSPRENCRCDKRCSLYGDCCVDYLDHCVNDTGLPVTSSNYPPFFECVTPLGVDTSPVSSRVNFTAVGRCPPEWPKDSIRQYCENETLGRSQKMLTAPVNGPDNVVFKNVYCALCHRVPEAHIEPWSLELWNCQEDTYGFPDFDTCLEIESTPPLSASSDPHRCYQVTVDSCPSLSTETQTALCENHTAMVFEYIAYGTLIAYNNVYCVDCNNPSVGELLCSADRLRQNFHPLRSFTLLFDFTARTVTYGVRDWSEGMPQILGNCSLWQMFDPFQGVCRNLSCPTGWTLQSEQCRESQGRIITDQSSSYSNRTSDCLNHLLSSDSIVKFLRDNSLTQVEFSLEGTEPNIQHQIYIHAEFSIARNIQDALDQFVHDGNLTSGASISCNSTMVMLIALSQVNSNKSWMPICEGFTLHGVQLSEIYHEDGVFLVTTSGYAYKESEFMHATLYEFREEVGVSNYTSKQVYLSLCSPFVVTGCPVVAFDRNEFLLIGSGDDVVFVHKTSRTAFSSDDVWQLPDGTLRMCNVRSRTNPVDYPAWLTTLSGFSFAGSVVSIVSLLMALITYSLFPALRNQPGKIVMNLMAALILAHAFLMVGKISIPWLCVLRAVMLHFAWLAAFSWMSVLTADLAYSLKSRVPRRDEPNRYKVVKLGVLAWGFPALFTSVSYLVSRLGGGDHQSWVWLEYGGSRCWIEDQLQAIFAFGVPVGILVFSNCILVAFIFYIMMENRRRLVAAHIDRDLKTEILLCLKLVGITGLTWSLFFAANVVDSVALWYMSVLVNSLQGALFGLMFLLKDSVRALWRHKLYVLGSSCRGRRSRHQKNIRRPPAVYNIPMAELGATHTSSSTSGEAASSVVKSNKDDNVVGLRDNAETCINPMLE